MQPPCMDRAQQVFFQAEQLQEIVQVMAVRLQPQGGKKSSGRFVFIQMVEDFLEKNRLLHHGDIAPEQGVFQIDGQGLRGQGFRRQNQADGGDIVQGLLGRQQPSATRDDLQPVPAQFPDDRGVENPGSGNGGQQFRAWLPCFFRGQAVAEILKIDMLEIDEA